jgi:hypothetical protein
MMIFLSFRPAPTYQDDSAYSNRSANIVTPRKEQAPDPGSYSHRLVSREGSAPTLLLCLLRGWPLRRPKPIDHQCRSNCCTCSTQLIADQHPWLRRWCFFALQFKCTGIRFVLKFKMQYCIWSPLVVSVHSIFTLNIYHSNGWIHADTTTSWTMKYGLNN